jgi:hypothetical protein
MASAAHVSKEGDEWLVQTPYTVLLDMGRGVRRLTMDDHPWPCVDNGSVIIPPGEHRLRVIHGQRAWLDPTELETRLVSINGELLGGQARGRGMELEYRSPTRCAMLFSKSPENVKVDGVTSSVSVLKSDNGYMIVAPPGQHRVQVQTQSAFSYAIDFTSWVSASLIVLFGMLSSGLLAVLFLITVIRRRLRIVRRHLPWRARHRATTA